MEHYDVIVIGGGLLGCFSLRALTRYKIKAALLEAREDVCTGISRANTAIIYSGYDTKPGTLKSEMCVRASHSFDKLCAELGVRYSPCGSVMVSFGPKGEESLKKKLEQGIKNGVQGLRLLNREQVLELEPNLSPEVRSGLYAPNAGTVNPWELGIAAAENAWDNGADFYFNTEVTGIERTESGYIVNAGGLVFAAKGIINCAGLYADRISEMVSEPSVRIFPDAADYYVLDTKVTGYINHVIFHESEEKDKGLTLVPTVDGNILLGPSRVDAGDKNYAFPSSSEGLNELFRLVKEVIPGLPMSQIIRSFAAQRPNPYWVHTDPATGAVIREERSISNFTLHEDGSMLGFISLIGIKTPGLTCSEELGRYAAERIVKLLGGAESNEAFNPIRKQPYKLADMDTEERAKLISANPSYGNIICRCRGVTEGEIINSIRRCSPSARNMRQGPHAVTVDGVKRRTAAGSGRCQGGFCTQKITELLAKDLNIPLSSVTKDRPGSWIIGGNTDDDM